MIDSPEHREDKKTEPVTSDEQLLGAFDYLVHELYGGSAVSCYLDLMLAGSGAPAIFDFKKLFLPPETREKLSEIEQIEEYDRRRKLIMNYLLKNILSWLKSQIGTDNDLSAIDSLTMYDSDPGVALIQALLLTQPKSIAAMRKLFVTEIGPIPKNLETDSDTSPLTAQESREIVSTLLTTIVRNRLMDLISEKS